MSDAAKEGEELAKAWLRGEGPLFDDLADLVESMSQPLDPVSRTFLQMIGNSAKASARGKARPAYARIEAQTAAQPTPEDPLPRPIDLNELLRRRQAREHARRIEAWGRYNNEAWADQAEMVRGMGAGGDWR
jgi:hypothetical protein